MAICTQDELVPDRLDRGSPILYFLLDADCKSTTPTEEEGWLSLGTAQHNDSAPQVHEILHQFPGWFVESVQVFVPLNAATVAEYERVLLCHCQRDLTHRRSSGALIVMLAIVSGISSSELKERILQYPLQTCCNQRFF